MMLPRLRFQGLLIKRNDGDRSARIVQSERAPCRNEVERRRKVNAFRGSRVEGSHSEVLFLHNAELSQLFEELVAAWM